MRVLIVSTSERKGGAAVAASRLTEALINNGVKAKMLVMEKQTHELYVADHHHWLRDEWNFIWERMVIWCNNLLSRRNLFKVSIANTGIDITRTPEFQEADIIHLHWVQQGFLSLKGISKILASGKPVVWTMHDMWPITGICHHAYQCRRYETGCCHCPFLRLPGRHDLSARVFRRKQAMLRGPQPVFVAVSRWLAGLAQRSLLTADKPLSVIPNSLSLAQFALIDRSDARSTLHLQARYIIAFGAARIDDDIKGLTYLLQALQTVIDRGYAQREDMQLLLFGGIKNEGVLSQVPTPYIYYGYVNDPHQMSLIYSSADAVVSASLYETFGQTLIEAQACGALPVSFGNSGQSDTITHRVNGYLADYLSTDSLAEGLNWAFHAGIRRQLLRSHVLSRYTESVVALKYADLYQSLLK